MHTEQTTEAVFHTLLDPDADVIQSASDLGLSLAEFLAVAESPEVTSAIEALEKIAQIRARLILARSAHTAVAALERIAAGDPQTPGAIETCRKAAAQILRESAKATSPVPLRNAEGVAESSRPGEADADHATNAREPTASTAAHEHAPAHTRARDEHLPPSGRLRAPSPDDPDDTALAAHDRAQDHRRSA